MAYGNKGTVGKAGKGGPKAKNPFASRKMPTNKGNEVKASHKGHAK